MKKEGRITVDGVEYFFDEDWTYVTPTTLQPPILSEHAPTEETEGEIGQIYFDTSAQTMYFCTKINDITTETGEEIKQYVWKGAGADIDTSAFVTIEDFNKLVNNEIQIVGPQYSTFKAGGAKDAFSQSIAIGKNATTSTYSSSVAIGNEAKCHISNAIAIGNNSWANGGRDIAIGYYAKANAGNAIQLGEGENRTKKTLQVASDNIYNWDTHTLTVQNIELNGVDITTKFVDLDTEQTITGVKTFSNTIYQLDAEGNSVEIANKNDLSAVSDAALSDDSKTLTVTKRDGTTFDFQGGGGGTLVYVAGAVQESISVDADLQGQLNALNQEVTTIKSTIPTNNNQLTNGAGYITSSSLSNYVNLSSAQTITGVKTFGEIHATAIYLD